MDAVARIGPNSISQLATALKEQFGDDSGSRVFSVSGFGTWYQDPPTDMVPESAPQRLFRTLFRILPQGQAFSIARDAGHRTADYVMANRIPAIARMILKLLPSGPSARLLLKAIEKNAWTFVGSGACHTRFEKGEGLIEIENNPLKMPGCAWHHAVFRRLFVTLVSSRAQVIHEEVGDNNCAICRFRVTF